MPNARPSATPNTPPAKRARSSTDIDSTDTTLDHDWIGTAIVPNGVEIRLVQVGDEFTILLEHTELMSTRASCSEQALATMTHARLGDRAGQEWLIGGYGMGYTLRAALAVLPVDAGITIAEIVPEIIDWALGPMHALTDGCLDDPRVMLVKDDVALLIDSAREAYDAILLDVDNGPDGLTRRVNDDLYYVDGLQAAMAALRHGGILAVWSSEPDAAFAQRLVDTGFDVEEVTVDETSNDRGTQHTIWFAQKP